MRKISIGWLLFSSVRQFRRLGQINRGQVYKKDFNVGGGRLLIIKLVVENPGMSQNSLCDEIGLNKTTIALSVKKLIKEKFIYKTVDKRDQRYYRVYPTKLAIEMTKALDQDIDYHTRTLFKGFSKKEIDQFVSLLERIYRNLTEEIDKRRNK